MKVASLALALVFACRSSAPPADRYTVKGRITALPGGASSKEVEIDTEKVPAFKGFDGVVKPMDAMAMRYEVDEVSLVGFANGDGVEITFETRWNDAQPLHLVGMTKLAPGTRLELDH